MKEVIKRLLIILAFIITVPIVTILYVLQFVLGELEDLAKMLGDGFTKFVDDVEDKIREW